MYINVIHDVHAYEVTGLLKVHVHCVCVYIYGPNFTKND